MLNSKTLKLLVRLGSNFNGTVCTVHHVDHKFSQSDSRKFKKDYKTILSIYKIITSEKGVSI